MTDHDDDVDVLPTKSLFVEMLTRDIGLNRAIIDLVDNSVDGARRLRPEPDADLSDLKIEITVNSDVFKIKDNCGGIGIELAKKYAFRIGRPKEMPSTPNSVGQFGVGMKRALFKFGRQFKVISQSTSDRFALDVDVDTWEADPTQWRFKFTEAERGLDVAESETGTEIIVTRLRGATASSFGLTTFQNSLSREIASAQQQYIDRGLKIVFNGTPLLSSPWTLLKAEGFEPEKIEKELQVNGVRVLVRIFAGIQAPNPRQAGWYIFCNGRMVLEADQSALTGWGRLAESDGVVAPKYHNQFAMFRGYVFFDSEDASLLPWNTTKTGVDEFSEIYKAVFLDMLEPMRRVLDFLRRLDDEKDSPEQERPLNDAIKRAAPMRIRDISRSGPFIYPERVIKKGPPLVSIQYRRPRNQIEALQNALSARSAREVGETTFDLYYNKFSSES